MRTLGYVFTLALLIGSQAIHAAPQGMDVLTITQDGNSEQYSVTLQVLLLMTALSFLPAALLMLTSFTRIIIVLAILRQALGLQQTPPTRVLIGIALALTLLIMTPVFENIYAAAITPYLNEQLSLMDTLKIASKPIKEFMLANTRTTDIEQFLAIANMQPPATPEDLSFSILIPSFITSELKTAFQIGFIIYLPFLVIDLVVASVLMAMGMIMLSPQMISLPFKLMLFVLVDGWALTMGTLASSFF
ncbi:flagellar type III secretion system pore protein FliP [Parendozoicomonas haliclonae]|uniref:Flagellar biosynthetic protein FliP n=1 Tax=Parendozoicomonas haliclonae TaxID=1960125 RepID=A0A1X7AGF5_9GAMM|nr:flagellar type III secretion system pore protein FliP [Parendozoicomonas haliclonae]SMA39957.1 Flagellar biosynthetic protein FliP precursor [Parendozoicomonas haliclonae]